MSERPSRTVRAATALRAPAGRVRRARSAVGRRVRGSRVGRRLVRPAVSVVLPIYNVEEYLAECLDSVLAQTWGDFELLVVDDGSPDGSRAIAERYAEKDPRIRILTRPNGGLGAARNTGLEAARGRYLTFVDSDDRLPVHALAVLVGSAERSGSDIVVGSVERFDRHRRWRPEWTGAVHADERQGIRCEDFLPLLRNLYTWDKLFRRDFFLRQGLRFREGVVYEDQPIVTQLLLRARAVDVLPDVVYEYRAREDLSSLSQQTATLEDLDARIQAWDLTRAALRQEASPAAYDGWLQTLFDAHFHWYLTSPGTADDRYWHRLQAAVADLTADAPEAVWQATAPAKRVALELTRQGRREETLEFVRRDAGRLDKWPAEVRPGKGVLLRLPFLGAPGLDDDLFTLRPEQLELAHSVENVHWVDLDDGRAVCQLSGWAFVRKIGRPAHDTEVAVLLRAADGTTTRFPSTGRPEPAFPPPVDDMWCDHRGSTFLVELPLHDVLRRPGDETADAADSGDEPVVEVLLEVTAGGFTVTAPVRNLVRSGSAGAIPSASLTGGDRVVADWRFGSRLRFRREPRRLEVADLRLAGRTLGGVLEGPDAGAVREVVVAGGEAVASGPVRSTPEGRPSFAVTLPAAPGLQPGVAFEWTVRAELADGSRVALSSRGPMGPVEAGTEAGTEAGYDAAAPPAPGATEVVLMRSRLLHLSVAEWACGASAHAVRLASDDVLHVEGAVHGPVRSLRLATRHKKLRSRGEPARIAGRRFTAALPLRHELFRFGAQVLPVGEHDLLAELELADGSTVEVPVRMTARLGAELPVLVRADHLQGRVVRGAANGVRLVLVRPLGDAQGRYQQNLLRTTTVTRPLHRGVLMRSYFGELATDNGVAVQAELARRGSSLPVYWAVQDYSVPVPPGGIPVVVNTREYYELLGSVAYYVDNMYQPEFHTKPDGQVLVQTFHGYPFKQMGHPHWRNLRFSQAKIDSYDRRAAEWDYLVSPARYATPLLTEHFAYPGTVLEIGYPRNDVLQSPQAQEIREQTRRSLGIEDGQTAVLHAPTFRDYLSRNDVSAAMVDFFDYREAHRALGDDVVILVRGHAFNARHMGRVGSLPGVVDVTDYPEVSDLYLAADAAVVDYSSLRFDFAVTGKPMVFHVPDLGRYQQTRGWLLPFEETAPGPLVDTTAQVVAHLSDLDRLREEYAEAYARFRADYLDLEDGQAARRFVDAVFVPRGDAPAG